MAKFVDWANSLLNRFEEQVKREFNQQNRPISSHPNWKISSFSYFLSSHCVSDYHHPSAHATHTHRAQLPYRTGRTSSQARISIEQNIEQSLIQISKYRFSLVIAGLTKMLQRVNEIVS